MTPTLPRPIKPGEIKKGQEFQLTWDRDGMHCIIVATAAEDWDERRGGIAVENGNKHVWEEPNGRWELLAEAPTPAPAVGSVWVRPGDGARYVYTQQDRYVPYAWMTSYVPAPIYPKDSDALTPIIHGDGCSPWLWDKETDTAWVAGSCGFPVTHVQVAGTHYRSGYLNDVREDREIARRLIPWSERGQANG